MNQKRIKMYSCAKYYLAAKCASVNTRQLLQHTLHQISEKVWISTTWQPRCFSHRLWQCLSGNLQHYVSENGAAAPDSIPIWTQHTCHNKCS